jgi:hypothetical protein
VARRARRRLRHGAWQRLLPPERQEVHRLLAVARQELDGLSDRLRQEEDLNAGPSDPPRDP